MHLLIIIIHLIACFSLIMIVLLQSGKGQSMGAMFGGGSQALFGSSGASSFLTKITTAVAVVFMLTSLTLAYVSKSGQESVIPDTPTTQQEQQTQGSEGDTLPEP